MLWAFVSAGFGEVVAVRFAVGYRERDESVVATLLEVNARFGVEEVPVLVDIHVVAGFVVAAFDRVVDTPVLHVQITVQIGMELVIGLGIHIIIQFVARVTIIFVVRYGKVVRLLCPDDTSEMVAVITVDGGSGGKLQAFSPVVSAVDRSVEVVFQPLAADEVCLGDGVSLAVDI